ncbi:MAG: NAD+ synthase, partial [Candidatus Omnitrophica bacterium]|nr:NAD+ synthase [Candidatus Omnitrophota bacterium]
MIIRIASVQINCTVGDIKGNGEKILKSIKQSREMGADIVVFPELAITGYPPEDLLLKEQFVDANLQEIEHIKNSIDDIVAILGFVDKSGNKLYNAAAVICAQKIIGVYHKTFLPNYGVFDEKRYFKAGRKTPVFLLNKNGHNIPFSISICEDIWHLDTSPIINEVKLGSNLVFNINASPYHMGKIHEREEIVSKQAIKNKIKIAYINLVGGQDELVFDGQSFVADENGNIIARAKSFKEDVTFLDVDIQEFSNTLKKEIIHIETPLKNRLNPA